MAKLKIRKLIRENEVLTRRLNDTTAMLALIAHERGGSVSFNEHDLLNLPEARFMVEKKEGAITLTLHYLEPAPVPEEIQKGVSEPAPTPIPEIVPITQ